MGPLVVAALISTLLYVQCAPKRSLDSLETYHVAVEADGETKDLAVDVSGHLVVVSLPPAGDDSGEEGGSTLVIDYTKSMTGVYLEETQSCYLIGGVPKSVPSPAEFKQALEAHKDGFNAEDQLSYTVAEDYPIKDHSMLPTPLQSACAGLSLQWLEPATETQSSELDVPHLQRRVVCKRVCVRIWLIVFFSICRTRCSG